MARYFVSGRNVSKRIEIPSGRWYDIGKSLGGVMYGILLYDVSKTGATYQKNRSGVLDNGNPNRRDMVAYVSI